MPAALIGACPASGGATCSMVGFLAAEVIEAAHEERHDTL
jgi:hypothetical protein